MNIRQLEYAILLSQTLNFSQVAEQLGITQPSLSKQIRTLETELGVQLFDRSHSPLSLTPAGEHFIQSAKELVYKEEQLHKSLEPFREVGAGRLVIGATPFRSIYMMPWLVRKFKQKYPAVRVVIHEDGSAQLRQEAAAGKFDLAVVNLPVDESLLDVIPLEKDKLVLAVPQKYAKDLASTPGKPYPVLDLSSVGDLPFVVLGPQQELRLLFDKLCFCADLHPNIVAEVVGVTTSAAMARNGVGAALLPLQYLESEQPNPHVQFFAIESDLYYRQPAVVTRRGQYISEYAEYAIKLLTEKNHE